LEAEIFGRDSDKNLGCDSGNGGENPIAVVVKMKVKMVAKI
jgi:hypothetical protein